jgi:hypothetical protein
METAQIEARKDTLRTTLKKSGQTMKGFLLRDIDQCEPAKRRQWTEAINALDDDAQLEMIARFPNRAFRAAVANISGVPIDTTEANAKSQIRAWVKAERIDLRRAMKEMLQERGDS